MEHQCSGRALWRWWWSILAFGALLACAGKQPNAAAPATGGAVLTATPGATGDEADTPPLPPADGNPFAGARLYGNPDYATEVETAARTAAPSQAALLRRAGAFPTAFWLDSVASIKQLPGWLEEAQRQQARAGGPMVSVFAVYDLPNRDCNARASAGEFSADNNGESRYQSEFIDPIAASFRAHPSLRIVVALEPDSLANLATNLGNPNCSAAAHAYRASTAYAVSKLFMPHVSIYLDAAHAGWLGWEPNRAKIAKIFTEVLEAAGGAHKVRGFFTNVSNYNPLTGDEGRRLEPSNPCPNELSYVRALADSLRWAGIKGKGFLIDTGRNGRGGTRSKWGSWCNVRNAGLGERPRANPAPFVDAYYWIKPPGESDGTSDPAAARFDESCGSADAAPGAPEAGQWFSRYFLDLVRNANPPL